MASKRKATQKFPTAPATSTASAVDNDDADFGMSDSEDDSDDEFSTGELTEQASQQQLNIPDLIRTAQHERVMPNTRTKYEAQLRQMAIWAQSTEQFKHLVSNGGMKTPLDADAMVGYTEYLRNRMVKWPHHELTGTMKHLAVKSVSGFLTAARDTYALHGEPFPEKIDVYFSNFIRAYSLFIARLKNEGLYPDRTNSIGFSSSVYERICRKGSEYIQDCRGSCVSGYRQVWMFWLFLYNLMGRSLQVNKIKYEWISWQDDCMVIKLPTQKCDTNGLLSYWKRVYANPFKPWMCPILALAVHVFSLTPADPFSNCVFTGAAASFRNQFIRFMAWAFPEETLEGIPTSRITSHSPKRSGICLVNGNEVVKWDAAELRADHKVGLTSVYQTCAAPQQDGIMGRLLAGLEFASAEFNVAPPHLKNDDVAQIRFNTFVAHYDSYSATFKTVIPFLLANIVFHYHSGRLRTILPKGHPFWSSTLMLRQQTLLLRLTSKILGGSVGAESVLVLSGNSVTGDIRTDVAEIKKDVKDLASHVGSIRGPVVSVSDMGGAKIQEQLTSMQEDLRWVKQKLECAQDLVAASSAQVMMPRRCVPVFYLANSFKLYTCTPFNLLTRWVTPEPPAPAWRHIRNEMLPRVEGRRSQENLLSVYNHFMQAFLGCNPNISDVEANVDNFFQVAWSRMAQVCEWDSERSPVRSTKTVYNWLLAQPDKLKQLKNSKVIVSVTVAAEAARSARLERETAQVRSVIAAAEMESLIAAPEMGSVDAAASGLTNPAADEEVTVADIPSCVPRNALLYPSGAPRPLPTLRKGQVRGPAHDEFDMYIARNAPKVGAIPCWPCPFCLTARHFHKLQNLSRHFREVHDERRDEEKEHALARSDIACLVWCCNRGGASLWEPVLQ